MNPNIRPILIPVDYTIRETMKSMTGVAIKGAPTGIALIVNKKNKLLGIVTDGDIRRALVRHVSIHATVGSIMVKNPITVSKGLSEQEILEWVTQKVQASGRLHDTKVDHVIIVDDNGNVEDVVNFFELWKSTDQKNKVVCVIGLGFVGLTLAVALVDVGFHVIGFDTKKELVDQINHGNAPFHEKGLSSLLKFHVNQKNLKAVSSLHPGIADVYIVSVGTPVGKGKKPMLSHLEKAAKQIGVVLRKRNLVILRSTVPVGTTRQRFIPLLEKRSKLKPGEDFFISFAPERTVEGKAIEELRQLPQVIGGFNRRSVDAAANFFSNLNRTIVRVSSLEAAEMVKLVNNSFRDVSFGFSNELSLVCEKWGLDAVHIIKAANEGYPRNPIPLPSPGVGGVCLKKDSYIYIDSAVQAKADAQLPKIARLTNEYMPIFVSQKVELFLRKQKKKAKWKIFIIGFAFKGDPETSDLRGSSTLDVIGNLKKRNYSLFGYDPVVSKEEIDRLNVRGCSLREGFQKANVVLIMNNHRSYEDMDILGLVSLMNKPGYLFDCWQIFPREEIERIDGITYSGISGAN